VAIFAAIVESSDDIIVSKTLDGIITGFAENAEIVDWVADGAVCCELLSASTCQPVDTQAAVDRAAVDEAGLTTCPHIQTTL
jgi:hypothetical protein